MQTHKVLLDKLSYGEAQSFPLCCTALHARNVKERQTHTQTDGERETEKDGVKREEINVELEIKIKTEEKERHSVYRKLRMVQ